MNIIIIGCGKTGSRLAKELDEYGYDVAVVDSDEEKFSALGQNFTGLVVCGDVTHLDTLRNAGSENADIAIAVTSSDNINVMVAQMLKLEFELEQVYVRVLDPSREAVFRKFGLHTICPTRFETDIIFNLITDNAYDVDTINIGGSSVRFFTEKADKRHFGRSPDEIHVRGKQVPFAIEKKTGQIILWGEVDFLIEEGDSIIYASV